jgi:hypothetical protein
VVNISEILVTLLFRNQELFREVNLNIILVLLALRIFVLDIEDAQNSVMA